MNITNLNRAKCFNCSFVINCFDHKFVMNWPTCLHWSMQCRKSYYATDVMTHYATFFRYTTLKLRYKSLHNNVTKHHNICECILKWLSNILLQNCDTQFIAVLSSGLLQNYKNCYTQSIAVKALWEKLPKLLWAVGQTSGKSCPSFWENLPKLPGEADPAFGK